MTTPDHPTRVNETEAAAGSKEGVVRWVLLISLVLAIAALTLIWVTGALSQDSVESQMNVEHKDGAMQDSAANEPSSIDGIAPDGAGEAPAAAPTAQ